MKDKLRKLICGADNAMRAREYVKAYLIAGDIYSNTFSIPVVMRDESEKEILSYSIEVQAMLIACAYTEAHNTIHKMYDLTQPEEDKIRPEKK